MNTITSITTLALPHWNIRLVRNGDAYGLNDCLTNDSGRTLVEFYDNRHPHTPLGQFVSRYYAETLLARPTGCSLTLDFEVPSWTVSGAEMAVLEAWLALVY
jgi:hypothetical protein